jgi:hypothetical protein
MAVVFSAPGAATPSHRPRYEYGNSAERPARRHVALQVILVNDEAVLTDRNNSGGTYVDGRRVNEHLLRSGDVFRIGDTQFLFE